MRPFREEATERAEALVATILGPAAECGHGRVPALESIAAAAYVTDAEGWITAFNNACLPLSGRTPVLGVDRWCVTWRLYSSDGSFLPHAKCPMAVAIGEKRPVRGIEAIVERPDGSRIPMLPFPTPVLDDRGVMIGAVNLLVDLSIDEDFRRQINQAARCRRLARSINDSMTAKALRRLADEYDAQARNLIELG